MARAESESFPDDGRRISLAALCREAAAQFNGGDAADKIKLTADEDAEVAAAAAPLILILLRNLIDNALRHGGRAEVFAERRGGGACASVLDDGPDLIRNFPRAFWSRLSAAARKRATTPDADWGFPSARRRQSASARN